MEQIVDKHTKGSRINGVVSEGCPRSKEVFLGQAHGCATRSLMNSPS